MADAVPVLLPVRLETRFDDGVDGFEGTRLRVLVIPDVCWYDRTAPASDGELDLLDAAVRDAAGPVLGSPGAPASAEATAAFDALAAGVGPGRALWLARTFPAGDDGAGWRVDREAGPHRAKGPNRQTRITGLPASIELHALVGSTFVRLGATAPTGELVVTPDEDSWWPSWAAMEAAGLTFTVDLGPVQPVEIEVLYVVGVGELDADALVLAHVDAGDLGLLRPGAATNTVAGAPAADLGDSPEAWRGLAERTVDAAEQRLAAALLADAGRLGPLVGERSGGELRDPLVLSLWGALAGHSLREVWAREATAVTTTLFWALEHLHPAGPLPPIRISRQPYGVWPVSAWGRWDASDASGAFAGLEAELVPRALAAAELMAARAETGLGTVVGADEDRLWDLLSQTPTADAYELRLCEPVDMLRQSIDAGDRPRFDDWWDRTGAPAENVAFGRPDDGMIALGSTMPLPRLGFVLPPLDFGPNNLPLFLTGFNADPGECEGMVLKEQARWWATTCRWLADEMFRDDGIGNIDALLRPYWMPACLLWRLLFVSGSIVLDHALREQAGLDGPLPPGAPDLLTRIAQPLIGGGGPARDGYELFRKGLYVLAEMAEPVPPDGGPAFVAQLDQVLRGLLDTANHRVDPWLTGAANRRLGDLRGSPRPLGLYGWVDRPLTGTAGPDLDVGLLLAPSDAQARAAVVLRDKSLDDPTDRWHLGLTSRTIRAAVRFGDDVRAGAHPAEALGREVERLVGDRGAIDVLRSRFPVRVEHSGRRTCDGLQVLEAVRLAPPGTPPVATGLVDAGVSTEVADRIRAIGATLDAHADLLLAEAAHHALAGRAEAAAKALEAAAGLGTPPELQVLATPSRGRSVRTTVLTALASAPLTDDAGASPVALASPAVAAWLATLAGAAGEPAWTWTAHTPAGDTAVTLGDLGLSAADVVVLDDAALSARIAGHVGVELSAVDVPPGPAAARSEVTVLGPRPLSGMDLGVDPRDAAAFDAAVRVQLESRVTALLERAGALAGRLEAPADEADRVGALAEAERWAVRPPAGDDGADPDEVARGAAAALRQRLADAPEVPGSASIDALAEALVALAAPRTVLPVLVDALAPLPGVGALTDEASGAGGRPALDETWLELTAVVRPPLARLEAHQALAAWTGGTPWAAATSSPGDPWATAAAAGLERKDPTVPHVVIVYGPAPVAAAGEAAWSVLDRYAEVIPFPEHTATGAMRFNAPAAQAPQAILLAVPARPGEAVDAEAALATIHHARLVAHARMARPEDLGPLDLLLPVVPGVEDGAFHYRVPADRTG